MCSIIEKATLKRLALNVCNSSILYCSFLNSFSTSKCFDLFEVTFLFKFTKSAMSPLDAKFAFLNLALKCSAVNLLNSGVVVYLLWLCILFSTVKAVVVAKLLILGILSLTSFILALRVVLVAKLVNIRYYIFNIFDLNIIYIFFWQHHFLLNHLVYLNQQEQVLTY